MKKLIVLVMVLMSVCAISAKTPTGISCFRLEVFGFTGTPVPTSISRPSKPAEQFILRTEIQPVIKINPTGLEKNIFNLASYGWNTSGLKNIKNIRYQGPGTPAGLIGFSYKH